MEMLTSAAICRKAKNLAPLESQREYRERISSFIRMHIARLEALDSGINPSALPGNSMLIIAQTGCGKSYTASQLCKAAGIKLITVDCSALTLTGYKGCNLGELLSSAQDQMSEDEFSRAIVLFDEVDKMRIDGSAGNPQPNFLKLFDGVIQAEGKGKVPEQIDVSRMSFLFAGAFSGLEDIIRQRRAPRSIGFSSTSRSEEDETNLLSQATMADIKAYGFMDELLGRIGSLLYVPPLTTADYRTLIKGSSGSICTKYSNLFRASGVALDISDSACRHIAQKASESAMGARAVDPIVYNCLRNAFEHLDQDENINHVTVACRNDHLSLRFSHGKREYIVGVPEDSNTDEDAEAKLPKLPDVHIGSYLQSSEGVQELLELAKKVFDQPDTEEEFLLESFLRCCFHLMRLLNPEDLVLSSVTKLAIATNPSDGNDTCFDRIVTAKLKNKEMPTAQRNEFLDAHLRYHDLISMENHRFWVKASKDLRRNWYRHLLREAC